MKTKDILQLRQTQALQESVSSGSSDCSPLRPCSPVQLCKDMGCRTSNRGKTKYLVLDGFDSEFYLMFDASEDPETPEAKGKVDILVAEIGSSPHDSETKTRVAINVGAQRLKEFMFALGASRFSEQTQRALFAID